MRRAASIAIASMILALAACGRPEGDAKADPPAPSAAPNPTVGPLASMVDSDRNGTRGETWNAAQIDWQSYTAGLAKAKAEHKPICLVLYTGWCPHCRNYSKVFDDARVVDQAKRFVMIRLNADDENDVARKYQPDGGYVPRTFFLSPDGDMAADIHAPRPRYRYFFDERDPNSILGGMTAALAKFAR